MLPSRTASSADRHMKAPHMLLFSRSVLGSSLGGHESGYGPGRCAELEEVPSSDANLLFLRELHRGAPFRYVRKVLDFVCRVQ